MQGPVLNLIVFVLGGALAAAMFWPGRGLFARTRRGRRLANRVALEDTLKHLYGQEVQGNTCTLSSVAGVLQVSSARALALVQRMQQGRLVEVTDGRILLTDGGRRYALDVVRAHRLWERYLADETGVDPLEWHERAEKREHTLTPEDANALAERLGHPRFDPHGDPIPTADGSIEAEATLTLAALEPGDNAVVTHLEDEPSVVFAQLIALGLYVGMELRSDARSSQRIVFEADGRKVVLAPILAQNVSVRRLESGESTVAGTAARTLASLEPGDAAQVVRVSPACRGIERRRLMDLGIVAGTRVALERRGLTGGLSAYRVRNTLIALREEQAAMIGIDHIERAGESPHAN